jgi:hypothetical protein
LLLSKSLRRAGAHIGALQTVAKLVKAAGYFKIYDLVNGPDRHLPNGRAKLFPAPG